MQPNHYEVLGVPRTATQGEIKRAYKRAVSECHSDKPDGDAQRHRQVNAAWEALGTPEAKAKTDAEIDRIEAEERARVAAERAQAERRAAEQKSIEAWRAWAQSLPPTPPMPPPQPSVLGSFLKGAALGAGAVLVLDAIFGGPPRSGRGGSKRSGSGTRRASLRRPPKRER